MKIVDSHPKKPEPTEAELRKLRAWAELEYPWFAVCASGYGRMFQDKPIRSADGYWRTSTRGGKYASPVGLVSQTFQTWEDEPRFTEVI